jgi:hypothetical protein
MSQPVEIHPQMIQRQLEAAQIRESRRNGRRRGDADREAILEAMSDLERLRPVYREALAEQAHSVRVKQIADDLAGLEVLLRELGDQPLTEPLQERVRTRIRTWHYETRRWIQDLPHQPCLDRLPALEGVASTARRARVERLWLQAGGAWFSPPTLASRNQSSDLPRQLRLQGLPQDLVPDPLGSSLVTDAAQGPSRWICRPGPLAELMTLAREALEVEIGGPNPGGHAPFEQRRRRTSLKDAFAFTCLRIYEKAIGPESARQGDALRRDLNEASFDHFVAMVHRWVAGPGAPPGWEPGVEPIRKAIATQRAWQKLLKVSKCKDESAFNALPLEVQQAAARKLPDSVRRRLTPPAPPLI